MKLSEEKTKELVEQFRGEIAHKFDEDFTHKISGTVDTLLRKFFLKKINVSGFSNLTNIPEGTPVIISSVHKSHLDYMALGNVIYQSGNKTVPATIGGTNLFHGTFETMLPKLKCVALDRERVSPKNLRSRENLLYLSTFYDYLMADVVEVLLTLFRSCCLRNSTIAAFMNISLLMNIPSLINMSILSMMFLGILILISTVSMYCSSLLCLIFILFTTLCV